MKYLIKGNIRKLGEPNFSSLHQAERGESYFNDFLCSKRKRGSSNEAINDPSLFGDKKITCIINGERVQCVEQVFHELQMPRGLRVKIKHY